MKKRFEDLLKLISVPFHPACRSRASHHPEDGDPRLHAPPHSGDARELGRPGERSNGQPAQRSATGQLQPQFVAQLRPKQSSHTITIVARSACSAVLLSFVSLLTGVLFRLHHDALRSVFSERMGQRAEPPSSTEAPPPDLRPLTVEHRPDAAQGAGGRRGGAAGCF